MAPDAQAGYGITTSVGCAGSAETAARQRDDRTSRHEIVAPWFPAQRYWHRRWRCPDAQGCRMCAFCGIIVA
jgi:hypothetical protein